MSEEVAVIAEPLASAKVRRGHRFIYFECPHCGATHDYGPIDGDRKYRCLECGKESEEKR